MTLDTFVLRYAADRRITPFLSWQRQGLRGSAQYINQVESYEERELREPLKLTSVTSNVQFAPLTSILPIASLLPPSLLRQLKHSTFCAQRVTHSSLPLLLLTLLAFLA